MRQLLRLTISALVLATLPASAQDRSAKPLTPEQLREEMAYSIGIQAYIYGYPVVEMYKTRYVRVFHPDNKDRTPLNRFGHARRLRDHTSTAVVSPNNDTLYSSAWLDLSNGPILLHVPDTGGRYYTFQFMDFYTNNFAYVGKRVTGTGEGTFAVVGPRWQGSLPPGVRRIDAPTNAVWILGRTLVDGAEDLPAVHALQDQYTLTPLNTQGEGVGVSAPAPPPYDASNPLKFFAYLNAGLRENPPPEREAALMSLFARIGVGPDRTFKADQLDQATAQGLLRALATGKQVLTADPDGAGTWSNGWYFPPKEVGNYGDNYLLRAVIALKLLAALSTEEAVYPTTSVDDRGRPLHGKHNYVLRMERGQTPPVDAFWSLTLYRLPERLLAANPLSRYSLGDRTKGLKYGPDGSLEIYIQHESPGPDKEANWLPAPEGDFCLILRGYLPQKELRDGTWKVPPVRQVP